MNLLDSEIKRTKEEILDVQHLHYKRKVMDRLRYYEVYQMLKSRLYMLLKLKEEDGDIHNNSK
jgi:hypothetical protein